MKFSGASLSIRGNDDTDALKATYVSGTNYTLQGGVGGVLRKLLTVLDYPLFDSGESTASNNTDVRTGTTCSVVIPSTGTYMLFAVGMLQAQITLNFSVSASPAASVLCELQQDDGGGGGFITKNEADYTRSVASGFSGAVDSESGAIFVGYPLPTAAVAGRTYQYRLNATVPTASGGGSGSFACSGTQRHFCAVLALKTGG
jgi:hypothetical protein